MLCYPPECSPVVVGLEVSGPVVVEDLDTSDVVDGSSLIVTVVRVCEKETQLGFLVPGVARLDVGACVNVVAGVT